MAAASAPSYRLVTAPPEDACLAYVNTRYWRGSPAATETLHAWPELLAWAAARVDATAAELHTLTHWAHAQPQAAARLFELAVAMREVLWRVFGALAGGQPVAETDLAALNQALAEAPPRTELARAGAGFVWRTAALTPTMPALLAPVLWAAADLMTHAAGNAKAARIRQCANPKCLWLFVDASKAGTRRWCDMNACGNRAKAQRHYQKTKSG